MTGSLQQHEYRLMSKPGEKPDLERAFPRRSMGAGWECSLNDKWAVRIEFNNDTQNWLKAPESYGTLLTVRGWLKNKNPDEPHDSEGGVSLSEAKSILERLCDLLSFANGGYLGPIVVVGRNRSLQKEVSVYSAYMTTPIELLSPTWLALQCDLCDYLSCFGSFHHMLQSERWKNLYVLVLIWYFQAIQPYTAQVRGKPWQIAIVALAALIERLTYEIVDELTGEKRTGGPEIRLKRVLGIIGILPSRFDDEYMVDRFFKVRNNALHPVQNKSYPDEELELAFDYGVLWVEEIMLWRMGYKGKYRNRLRREGHFVFDAPRYDITTRHSSWV